jgi:hypothetical protein
MSVYAVRAFVKMQEQLAAHNPGEYVWRQLSDRKQHCIFQCALFQLENDPPTFLTTVY